MGATSLIGFVATLPDLRLMVQAQLVQLVGIFEEQFNRQ
jgi:hypothetical protein